MKENTLIHTNFIVCIVITVGFIVTSIIGYQSNAHIFKRDIEHVSALAGEGIYYQIDKIMSEPVNVSLTMANDSLLKAELSKEVQHLEEEAYIQNIGNYLHAYREKYEYDSVFLVSTETSRYYHFEGLDRVLKEGDPENVWYYEFLNSKDEYSLNIDNDEATDNSIMAFVNCKIRDEDGSIMGIIGVGMKVDSLQSLLKAYDEKFNVVASLIDGQGVIQLSSQKTGYEGANLFEDEKLLKFKDVILEITDVQQTFWLDREKTKEYLVTQYVDSLQWYLVVENDTTKMYQVLRWQFVREIGSIALLIIVALFTVTKVLKKYKLQIMKLSATQIQGYQNLLLQTTVGMYDSIYELDITNNRAGGENKGRYFVAQGINEDTPYDEALYIMAKQQIKKEYAEGYLETFLPENVLRAYNSGITNLRYDMMSMGGDGEYHWIRITGRIFYWASDETVRMISYRMNVDEEKKKELVLLEKSQKDAMTGLLNKGATEKAIFTFLKDKAKEGSRIALLMIDLDDFKNVNDKYGHAFGDTVLAEFAAELNHQFREDDIVGRIGGDEFTACMSDYGDAVMLREKLERFCTRIKRKDFGQQKDAAISCSVGVSLYPEHGKTYSELYERADQALYYAKAHGKNMFHILDEDSADDTAFHMDARDVKNLLDNTTDGVAKFACIDKGALKLLYFNQKYIDMLGVDAQTLSQSDFSAFAYLHPEDLEAALIILNTAVLDKRQFEVRFRMRYADGHYFWVKLRGLFIKEIYQNKYPVFYAVYTDMSGFEQSEEEVAE